MSEHQITADVGTIMCDIITQASYTPLFLASLNSRVAVVKLLIERKADVSICNKVCLFSHPVDNVYITAFIYRVN